MKNNFKLLIIPVVLLVSILLLNSCEKSDSETMYGSNYIYIPQAMVSGGQNLHYLVPTGANTDTYNYKVDAANNKVNVLLGVVRSGMQANESYTVDIITKADTINQLITNGKINLTPSTKPVVLLPSASYTLPSNVTVPTGANSASFNLSINMTDIKTYAGKKVALCVAIANPTKYSVNTLYNRVVVLIDVDLLKLP